ncbi:hypothetical protein KBI33_03110, partial [Candidatus Shapirobacteria bacterium]|nr:hypothetical protein [Candidatus Shapirobacteria bacterium]
AQCADTPPDKATDLFPNGGHYSDNENITLFWSNLADNQWGLNCEGNDNRYFVYYCKAGDGCSATSVSNINECTSQDGVVDTDASPLTFSCTITNSLEWGSTYYWKVVTSNGELTNEAFGSFNTGYPSAWWQTETGDVYGKGGIVSPIWRDVAENQRYFSLINDSFGAHSGLVASLNANDNDFSGDVTGDNAKGEGQATETDFYSSHHQALAADFSRLLNDYSFAKLASLVDLAIKDDGPGSYNSGVKVITVADASSIERNDLIGNDPSHPQPAPDNLYYYPPYGTGDMAVSIDSPFSVGANEKFVIFVDDDLNINQSITVAPGGFLAFIVKEDITIAPGVTQVQGVYFADGSLIVESSDATDEQFKGQGIFVAKEGASLKRNFRNARNAEEPTEVFTFDPSYLFTAPKVFREKPYLWREVVP